MTGFLRLPTIGLLSLSFATGLFAQSIVIPKPGSALRTRVLNGLRGRTEKLIGAPVVFKPFTFNVYGSWAFVIAQPVQKNGKAFNYAKTKLHSEYKEGKDNWSDEVEGLLRKGSKGWTLVHFRHNFSDFDGDDLSHQYGLPIALFKAPGAG